MCGIHAELDRGVRAGHAQGSNAAGYADAAGREFYTTCHLMAGGKLEPEEAKTLAGGIERRLNELLAEISDTAPAERERA